MVQRSIRYSILAAVAACVMGYGVARACDVRGQVVCATDATKPVSNVLVSLQQLPSGELVQAYSDGFGVVSTHVGMIASYQVTPNSTPNPVACTWDLINANQPITFTIAVDDPIQCPEPTGGACSPGFFKNNIEKWCSEAMEASGVTCTINGVTSTYSCSDMIPLLSANKLFYADYQTRTDATLCLNALVDPALVCPGDFWVP